MDCNASETTPSPEGDATNRCSYVHDVTDFDDVDGSEWRCPREPLAGTSRCGFHLDLDDTPADWDAGTALLDALSTVHPERTGRRTARQFFGAQIDEIDLDYASISGVDNYPIDLRECHVSGAIDLTRAVVDIPLWLDDATVDGTVHMHRTRFAEHVSLNGLTCDGDLVMDRASFDRNLDAESMTIEGDLDCRGTSFEHYVGLIGSHVRGDLDLHNVTVDDHAHVHDLHVEGDADLGNAVFAKRLWCFDSTFEGTLDLEKAIVGGPAFFDYSEFGGTVDYWNTTFEGRVRWKESVFRDKISAAQLTTESTARFQRPTFQGPVDLSHLNAPGGLWITNPTAGADDCQIALQHAELAKGSLDSAAGGTVTYDLTQATLGAVDLELERLADLTTYRFDRTRFDGFDFAAHHDLLDRTGWRLEPPTGDATLDATRAEETYLKAKNGAKQVGDATAAAEFFRHEMTNRRHNHAARARTGGTVADRLTAAGRWTASALLDATTGYGERPWRVVASSVGVILLFVIVYALSFETPPYGVLFGYLVFSVESFVALVLGGAPRIEPPFIRFIAQVEGFMGAFFIALFVFTLTRSIQR